MFGGVSVMRKNLFDRGIQYGWRNTKSIDDAEQTRLDERRQRFASHTREKPTGIGGYGFVSRGDDHRLQQSDSARRAYFEEIMSSFVVYANNLGPELRAWLQNVEKTDQEDGWIVDATQALSLADKNKCTVNQILMALRKLREALLSSETDAFAKRVFLFSVRIAASMGHYQTYIPSIHYLLHRARPLLTPTEMSELATLLSLHLAHFNQHNTKALETYHQYKLNDRQLFKALKSWSTGDYFTWVKIYNSECDACKSAVMAMGLPHMMSHLINVIQSSYFTVTKSYLEQHVLPDGVVYDDLVQKYRCQWQLDNDIVIVRKRLTMK